MKFTVIAKEEFSKCDVAAILKFDSKELATAAAAEINAEPGCTKYSVSVGNTGAISIGDCVVFNSYSDTCYDTFIKKVKALQAPAPDGDDLAKELWDGMADPHGTAEDDREVAIRYIKSLFPETEFIRNTDAYFYVDYDGAEYCVQLDYVYDEHGEVEGGELTFSDYYRRVEPIKIDRSTPDVKETLEKFFKKVKSAGESSDYLAKELWDGISDPDNGIGEDRETAIRYLRSMFPEAKVTLEDDDHFCVKYDGVEYTVQLIYVHDEHGEVVSGELTVYNYDCNVDPIKIDRSTTDVKETLEKFFKKVKSAGESHAANLWESMADTDNSVSTDANAAIVYLESILPGATDISMRESDAINLEHTGMEYTVGLYYYPDTNDGFLRFVNRKTGRVDLEIDRNTENPDEKVKHLFEKATTPGESPDRPQLEARVTKLESVVGSLEAEIKEIKEILKK